MSRLVASPLALLLALPGPGLAAPVGTVPPALVRRIQDDAEERYRFLAGLAEKGLHERAVREARELLRLHPRHPRAALARFTLAGSLWELDRHEEAAREYETVAAQRGFEYRAEALFRCGEAARERGDLERERAAFAAVLDAGQEYLLAPARLALGEAELRAGRPRQAEDHYRALLERHGDAPEAAQARRGLTWCAWRAGDAEETARRARAFLEVERDQETRDELTLLLGEALLRRDPDSALEAFATIRSDARRAARTRGEGFALAALGRHREAAEAFERLLRAAPDGPFAAEATLQAGVEHLRGGDVQRAVRHLTAASAGGDAEGLYWLALAHERAGAHDDALAALERGLAAGPDAELAGRMQVLRGDCLAATGRTGEAQRAYVASGSDHALYAAGITALDRGDVEGALELARRLLASAGDGASAQPGRVLLAEARFAAGDHARAEEALVDALRSPTDDAEAARLSSRHAWCAYLTGRLEEADARFAEVARRHGSTPEGEEARYLRVRVAAELGHTAEAGTHARRYLEAHPGGRFADGAALALARAAEPDARAEALGRFLEEHARSPLRAGALLELAELESASERRGRARRAYREVLEVAPEGAEAPHAAYGLAWCAWEDGDHAECERALAWLERREDLDPELRVAALELGVWSRVGRGALDEARTTWRSLAAAGGSPERRAASARRIAAALRERGELERADEVLEECLRGLERGTLAAEVELERAYVALERGDLEAMERALARARRSGGAEPALAEAGFHLGEARHAAGDEAGALASWESAAVVAHPRAADALYRLGFAHLARGETEEAERALASLLERHPDHELVPEARFLHGECAYRRGDFAGAAGRLARARESAPAGELGARVLFRLGLALGELERWPECAEVLTELARAHPRFPNLAEGELWRGRALAALGDTRRARAAFERTLALADGELEAGARLGLGRVDELEQRPDDALSQYLKVALLYDHEEYVPLALLAAGRVLEAQDEPAQAAARYRELLEQHPRSPHAREARARLAALEGGR